MESRYLDKIIKEFCFSGAGPNSKMALVEGPRQTGKTSLAKTMLTERGVGKYYNWDQKEFRAQWAKQPSKLIPAPTQITPIVIFDEIHKAKSWKRHLKGIYDTLEHRVDIIVTGSARLGIYKRGSDSLLGRYFSFRLHPFTLAELLKRECPDPDQLKLKLADELDSSSAESRDTLNFLLKFGGFPDPFFGQSERRARAWRALRTQQLIREDLRDLSRLPELSQIEMLVALLPEQVGSTLSRTGLSEDLEVAYTTVARWLNYLSALYFHFEIKPYSKSIKRSLKKEGKLYLWDYSEVKDTGARFENLVAQHLLKLCHYWSDCGHGNFDLSYLKTFEDLEIDFLVTRDGRPFLPVEAKLSDTNLSTNWNGLLKQLGCEFGVQVVNTSQSYQRQEKVGKAKVLICDAATFLVELV